MNLDDYLKNVGELADALAEADVAAEKATTLDVAIATADMFDSDEWVDWALELVPLPKNPSGPNGRRPKTRIRFHKATMIWAEQNGHPPFALKTTVQNVAAGQAVRHIPKESLALFWTERQVRPLVQLMKAGLQSRIPEAVEIATKGDMVKPTSAQVLDAVKEIKHKANAGGGTRYTPLADEVTASAEFKAEEAFRKLVKAARKSANGAEQVNKYIQFIKDETRAFRRG
jgi:hypothetical protein